MALDERLKNQLRNREFGWTFDESIEVALGFQLGSSLPELYDAIQSGSLAMGMTADQAHRQGIKVVAYMAGEHILAEFIEQFEGDDTQMMRYVAMVLMGKVSDDGPE